MPATLLLKSSAQSSERAARLKLRNSSFSKGELNGSSTCGMELDHDAQSAGVPLITVTRKPGLLSFFSRKMGINASDTRSHAADFEREPCLSLSADQRKSCLPDEPAMQVSSELVRHACPLSSAKPLSTASLSSNSPSDLDEISSTLDDPCASPLTLQVDNIPLPSLATLVAILREHAALGSTGPDQSKN